MSGFYVLNVPEFAPVLETAKTLEACRVHAPRAGYTLVEFDGEIEISRSATGLTEAVWFGCLTGGLDGKITHFDAGSLRIAPTNEPAISG